MKSQLREFVKQVIKEEEDYQQLFKTMRKGSVKGQQIYVFVAVVYFSVDQFKNLYLQWFQINLNYQR